MTYELRKFSLLNNLKLIKQFKKDYFQDIYIFKKQCTSYGVKFRNIQQKKYGYKIHSVQIKINTNSNNIQSQKHLNFYQKWIKLNLKFKYRLYLPEVYINQEYLSQMYQKQLSKLDNHKQKINSQLNSQQSIKLKLKSFQNQLQHLNLSLIQTIKQQTKFDKQVQNYLNINDENNSNIKINVNSHANRLLDSNNKIEQIFIIKKNKNKGFNYEYGDLQVIPMHLKLHNTNNFEVNNNKDKKSRQNTQNSLFFSTVSFESSSKQKIQSKIHLNKLKLNQKTFQRLYKQQENHSEKDTKFQYNSSYPQLIEDVYMKYLV